MNKIVISIFLLFYTGTLYALKVNITKELPSIVVNINGEDIKIQRIQDTKHKLNNSYTKTSRPTPPFNLQPFTPIKGIKTVTELDVIDFIKSDLRDKNGLLIDARMPKWYKYSTIPTALNVPFSLLHKSKNGNFIDQIFDIFDVKKSKSGWDFKDAQTLLIFDNGPWCQQGVTALKNLINLGYPKSKLLYYRGGLQYWQIVGLTTTKDKKHKKMVKKSLKLSSILSDFKDKNSQQNHTINLAGKQRMLTQKMSKDSILLKFFPDLRDDLKKSYKLYDKTLAGLLDGDKTLHLVKTEDKKIRESIKNLQSIWKPFKNALIKLLDTDNTKIDYIIQNNIKLLHRSDTLVKILKKSSNPNYLQIARLNIVDLAGRERMLTQKMTKEKLLVLEGIDTEKNLKNLKESRDLFENSLNILISGDSAKKIPKPTNKKIKQAFNSLYKLWIDIKPYYDKKILTKDEIYLLNRKSLHLLTKMDRAVKLCESVRDY